MAGPGDRMTAVGLGHMRSSRAHREQAVELLKTAFVQGRLTMDEFEERVGQTLSSLTYGQLAALTADLPAGLAGARPRRAPDGEPVRPPGNAAVKVSVCAIIASDALVIAFFSGNYGFFLGTLAIIVVATLVAGAQVLCSWCDEDSPEIRSRGPSPGGPSPGEPSPGSHDRGGYVRGGYVHGGYVHSGHACQQRFCDGRAHERRVHGQLPGRPTPCAGG